MRLPYAHWLDTWFQNGYGVPDILSGFIIESVKDNMETIYLSVRSHYMFPTWSSKYFQYLKYRQCLLDLWITKLNVKLWDERLLKIRWYPHHLKIFYKIMVYQCTPILQTVRRVIYCHTIHRHTKSKAALLLTL